MMSKKNRTSLEIIKSAEKLFVGKGIEKTTVMDIADGADITRRTFYRHFKSKEEVAYEVIIDNLIEWESIQSNIVKKILIEEIQGLQALEKYLKMSAKFMLENKKFVKIFIAFDYYFTDEKKYELSQKILKRFYEVSKFSEKQIAFFIQQGIDNDEMKAISEQKLNQYIATISTFLWRGGQQLYMSQRHLENEFGVLIEDIFNCQIDLYISGLKNIE